MVTKMIVGLTLLTYGVNGGLFWFLKKERKVRSFFEKAALFFSVNVSLVFFDGVAVFLAKLIADGILAIE